MLRVSLILLIVLLSSCVKKADRVGPKDTTDTHMQEIYDDANKSTNEENLYRAIYLHKKNCDLGYAQSCNRLGVIYLNDKFLKKDAVKAQYFFHRSCKLGDSMGCHNEGNMLRLIRNDFPSAIGVYKDNCHNNHYTSCFNLGMMYAQGRGIAKPNKRLAKKYFKKACEGDVIEGCKIFANMSKKQIRNTNYK